VENNISKIPNPADREYFRVDGQIYFYCEKIHPTENEEIAKKIYIPTFAKDEDDIVGLTIDAFRERLLMSELEDQDLKLFMLELQQIMAMMKLCFDEELKGKKQKIFLKTTVNISGSGMAFQSSELHCVNDFLKMYLFFPVYPYSFVSVLAKVIKCEKQKDGYWIKTHYEKISERERDEILRFVNQCQRDQMHERHGSQQAPAVPLAGDQRES
jgi:hypothetical protein